MINSVMQLDKEHRLSLINCCQKDCEQMHIFLFSNFILKYVQASDHPSTLILPEAVRKLYLLWSFTHKEAAATGFQGFIQFSIS